MYIAVNTIPNTPAIVEAFKQAAPDMKQFSGFLGMEIWKAADGTMQAVSRWTSKEALDEYIQHQAFRRHHGSSHGEGMSASGHISYYEGEIIG